jgi:hypothetical protein
VHGAVALQDHVFGEDGRQGDVGVDAGDGEDGDSDEALEHL